MSFDLKPLVEFVSKAVWFGILFVKKLKKKKYIYIYIYIYLVVLSLHCCVQAFSCCSEQGPVFVVVHGFPIVVAFLVAEQGL